MIATRYLQRAADLGAAAGTCAFIAAVPRPDCTGRFQGDWTPDRLAREVLGLCAPTLTERLLDSLVAEFERASREAYYGALADERRQEHEAAASRGRSPRH